ncbi:GH36 C-terminal domain-containing protein [Paenibacillus hexagrammi]|uniref:GH36 C-terminal domain-containing protein n=1 Tax=Paenibacillus hexagrammi TaxID=2908839 RepID=A0ABY3STT9_9BACL|nr:GH36 C-terminal domain-containing protein [Paenibacillus sp. YPD9-1]
MIVAEDKTEAIAFYFRVLAEPNPPLTWLRLKGLDPAADYEIDGIVYPGDHLLYAGLPVSGLHGDFQSKVWLLRKIESSSNWES